MAKNKPKTNRAGNKQAVSGYDVCQTPPHALEPLLPLLKAKQKANPNMVIWESASGPEELLANALLKKGFNVHTTDLSMGERFNFFTYDITALGAFHGWYIVQLTNMPFSIKYEWLQRSFELGLPFALLAPYETTFASAFTEQANKYHLSPWPIEILKPERRINFKMPNTGWGITEWSEKKQKMVKRGDSAQMPTAWITWGLNAGAIYQPYITTYEVPMRNVRYNDDNTERIK